MTGNGKITEKEKKRGFIDILKDGISFISQIISASVFPPIAEGAEVIMKNIEDRIMIMEQRIIKKITNLFIIGFGAIFLIFALFFALREYLAWSNTATFFSIGIVLFIIGLLLKIGESNT